MYVQYCTNNSLYCRYVQNTTQSSVLFLYLVHTYIFYHKVVSKYSRTVETGYLSDPLIKLGEVAPNPALFNNRCHTFLAAGAQQKYEIAPDGTEELEISLHTLEEINTMIDTGQITHALTINAIYWYEKKLKSERIKDK